MTKDIIFNFRVPLELRDQFVAACEEDDNPAAQVLRKFMRAYIEQRRQTDLEQIIRRQAKKG